MKTFKELILEKYEGPMTPKRLKTLQLQDIIKDVLGVKKVKFKDNKTSAVYTIGDYPDSYITVHMNGATENDWDRYNVWIEINIGSNRPLGIISKNKALIPNPSETGMIKYFTQGLKKQKRKIESNFKMIGVSEEPKKWKMTKVLAKKAAAEIMSKSSAKATDKSWYDDWSSSLITNTTIGKIIVNYSHPSITINGKQVESSTSGNTEEKLRDIIEKGIKMAKDLAGDAKKYDDEINSIKREIRGQGETESFEIAQYFLSDNPEIEKYIIKVLKVKSPVEWLAYS